MGTDISITGNPVYTHMDEDNNVKSGWRDVFDQGSETANFGVDGSNEMGFSVNDDGSVSEVKRPESPAKEDDSDDDIDINVVDDRPEEDRVPARAESESEDDDEDLDPDHLDEIELTGTRAQKRIKKLTFRYHDQRREREAAERIRDEAIAFAKRLQEENEQIKGYLSEGEKVLVSEVQRSTKEAFEYAKRDYRAAIEEGDPDKITEAQAKLNKAQYDLVQASSYKPQAQAQTQTQQPQPQQQFAPQGNDAQQPQVDQRTQRWLSENPWFTNDEVMKGTALGIHQSLIKSGVNPSSEQYYKTIDNRMREIYPSFFSRNGKADPVSRGRGQSPSVVAPANRSPGNPRTVTLTATQVQVAKRLGITPKQYAAQILKERGNV